MGAGGEKPPATRLSFYSMSNHMVDTICYLVAIIAVIAAIIADHMAQRALERAEEASLRAVLSASVAMRLASAELLRLSAASSGKHSSTRSGQRTFFILEGQRGESTKHVSVLSVSSVFSTPKLTELFLGFSGAFSKLRKTWYFFSTALSSSGLAWLSEILNVHESHCDVWFFIFQFWVSKITV